LAKIFRLETERVLSNDWVVQHENRFYQVERQSPQHAPAKGEVRVCEEEDGSLEIRYREQKLKWKEITARPVSAKRVKVRPGRAVPPTALRPQRKPGHDHPWRRGYSERNLAAPGLPTPAPAEAQTGCSPDPSNNQNQRPKP
jgi:hypothetical protein